MTNSSPRPDCMGAPRAALGPPLTRHIVAGSREVPATAFVVIPASAIQFVEARQWPIPLPSDSQVGEPLLPADPTP